MARGAQRGRGGGQPREVEVSKKLSWLLRHGAEKEHLQLGEGGYAKVEDVLKSRTIRSLKITFTEIQDIVKSNDKQRFALIPIAESPSSSGASQTDVQVDPDNPSQWLIRANQGHSLKVDSTGLLTPITPENAPSSIIHGTTRRAWGLIASSGGLKPMGRNHVHFAIGLPKGFKTLAEPGEDAGPEHAAPVISGMRNSSTILIYVDLRKAMDAGLEFGLSENGVVLCDGGEKGIIPIDWFERVEERGEKENVLVKDGIVVGELRGKK